MASHPSRRRCQRSGRHIQTDPKVVVPTIAIFHSCFAHLKKGYLRVWEAFDEIVFCLRVNADQMTIVVVLAIPLSVEKCFLRLMDEHVATPLKSFAFYTKRGSTCQCDCISLYAAGCLRVSGTATPATMTALDANTSSKMIFMFSALEKNRNNAVIYAASMLLLLWP
jgi:hypothetical protein